MHDHQIIPKYDAETLVKMMRDCGFSAILAKHKSGIDTARRSLISNGREITYCVVIEGETLKCLGEVWGAEPSPEFILNWNNNSPISPVIGTGDGAVLKYSTNICRGMTFSSFRVVVSNFEKAMIALDSEVKGY